MNTHKDTNQTYDSCKECEELAKEIVRLVKDRDNLSEHNRSLIKDLKETRGQVAELYALNSGLRYAASEMEQRIKRLNELIKQGNITGVSIDVTKT
jgi:methylphosphotriester-DNA--protein-cysteine methyltransferase